MRRDTAALTDGIFDLAIIGGGAFGAAAAWDATLRGLKTILIERDDFGGGASAECFKVVHGGIRYLQHGNIARLRSSCFERSALLRIAPHLVAPLPILIPTFGSGRQGKLLLGAGMRLYDLLSWGRNAGIRDASRHIPPTRFLSRNEVLNHFPDIHRGGLTGGAVFDDGQMYNPARLVLAFVKSATAAGAIACNYAEATGLLWDGNRVCGVQVKDRLNAGEFEVRAKLVLNAGGPGAEYLLEGEQRFGRWVRGCFSRDAYLIVDRKPRSPYALAVPGQSRDRDALLSRSARHLFAVPWRDVTLIGVWHRVFAGHPDTAAIEEEEIDAWLEELGAVYPSLQLKRDDVIYANCGLVPFGSGASTEQTISFGKESRFIDHRRTHGIEGLVTLIGIRFTTARGDAAKALNLLLQQLPKAPAPAATELRPLVGGDIPDFEALRTRARRERPEQIKERTIDTLLRNHGTEYRKVISDTATHELQCIGDTDAVMAEITYAVRDEMAMRLEDVVMRRTDIASASHPGGSVLEAVARRMQQLLGWSERRFLAELSATEKTLGRHFAVEARTSRTTTATPRLPGVQ